MFLSGLQKLTLLDYPGKVACTVFTCGCDLRCPFCHNASLVLPEQFGPSMGEDEVLGFLKKRIGILDGVAITGGEPLLHKELDDFLSRVKDLGYLIMLDTNGTFPEHLEKLLHAGVVDHVAMDVKNSPALYAKTVGIDHFDLTPVEQSRDILMQGETEYEFRTTVVKGLHTKESLIETAQWITGAKEYYLQQFRDSGNIIEGANLSAFDDKEMHALAEAVSPYVPAVQVRGV